MKKIILILLLFLCFCLSNYVYADQSSGGGTTLNGQPASYYLDRANHTGTQADSTLNTISTAGKVSGNAITSGTIGGSTAINTTGIATAAAFSGSVESYSVSVVQYQNLGIADNDTDSLVFPFVPSKIVLHYTGQALTLNSNECGLTNGDCVITITGNNAFNSRLNCLGGLAATTTKLFSTTYNGPDTVNVVYLYSGGAVGSVAGTATWTTATRTLLITYQEDSTTAASSFIEVVATAYR